MEKKDEKERIRTRKRVMSLGRDVMLRVQLIKHRPKFVDKYKVECYRCHMYAHYRSEYRTNLNKHYGERSNFVEKEEEEVFLLMVCHTKG